jgi:hypothetical protein
MVFMIVVVVIIIVITFRSGKLFFVFFIHSLKCRWNDSRQTPHIIVIVHVFIVLNALVVDIVDDIIHFVQHTYMPYIIIVIMIKSASWLQKPFLVVLMIMIIVVPIEVKSLGVSDHVRVKHDLPTPILDYLTQVMYFLPYHLLIR